MTAVSPVMSYADTASSYTVKIPTESVPFVATTASYDFGKVLVGQAPQRTFTFTNTGTDPTTPSSVTVVGGAQVLNSTCTGTLAAAQSCSFTAVLNVKTTGPNTGQIQVAHSANATPNVYSLTAAGITADALIAPVEPTLSFGDVLVRASSAPLTAKFKNIGATPLDILEVGLAEGGANFQVDGSACGTLQPNETCPVLVTFSPQYLGMIQGRLKVTLGDGATLNMTGLVGNGVQGTPAWSTSQMNYLDIPVGAASAAQTVTLTNSGRGALTVGKLFINGDASFQISGSTCGAILASGASIAVQLNDAPSNGATVTARTAPTCMTSAGGTCTVSGGSATIVLPANGSAVLNQVLTFGTAGSVAYTAAISPSGVQDLVLSNNTATATVQVVKPQADLSVTWVALPSQVAMGATRTVDLIIKNNSTGAMAAKGANGKVSLNGSATGGAGLNITGVTCPVVSAGATCDVSTGLAYLPAGGSVTARVAYTVSGTSGGIAFNATVDNYSEG